MRTCSLALLLLVLPAVASANEFVSLDRMSPASMGGVRLDLRDDGQTTYTRTELYGQMVPRPFGGYVQFPMFGRFPDDDTAVRGLGNIELGGLYLVGRTVLRVGVALPTASDDGDGVRAVMGSAWPRVTDQALLLPNTTALRLSASPRFRSGGWFFRIDAGADFLLNEEDEDDPMRTLLRANLGAGVNIRKLQITAEFVNISNDDLIPDAPEGAFLHTLAMSLRHGVLYTGVSWPLGDGPDHMLFTIGLEGHP